MSRVTDRTSFLAFHSLTRLFNADAVHALMRALSLNAHGGRTMTCVSRARVGIAAAALAWVSVMVTFNATGADSVQVETPTLEHVMTVRATIDATIEMGKTPAGQRRVIPISGGSFEGPALKGVVMPGGEDWQLVRDDGVTLLDANYWLRTEDGAIIRVHNAVLTSQQPATSGDKPTRYARSTVRFEAPIGKYEWLNRAIFVGTLKADLTQRPPVITLQFFRVN